MKKIVCGILAHVDAGKTTLSEGLLYLCGCIRKLGRVDHRDTFLDTAAPERLRGITVFSKQAVLSTPDTCFYLIDTPGHVDFSAETERVLGILDYAILVISAVDGVQVHTETLWRLLRRHHIPVFLFVNKTDLPGRDRLAFMEELHARLSPACTDFSHAFSEPGPRGVFEEQTAMCSEKLMEEYLGAGGLSVKALTDAIAARQVFPCFFGSALKMEGVSVFLKALELYTREPAYGDAFSASVFKIGRDPQRNRLSYMKITGGTLRVKTPLTASLPADDPGYWEEKIDQIRIYSGDRYKVTDAVSAGDVCCVTGLSHVMPGQGLGASADAPVPILEPVLSYRLLLPPELPVGQTYAKLGQLAEEDPQLHLSWDPVLREIRISLMGEIQMEILTQTVRDRFGFTPVFDKGHIVYRETISESVECAGHFEPLRHYAEVHLLLEPGEPGSGVTFDSVCPENTLARNWQRLILSQLEEELPSGVLTGFPLTDLRVVLTGGRSHVKHTEGGDFRQAACRALRQGLMKAREGGFAVLLEPWYSFRIALPIEAVGHALADLERMNASVAPMDTEEETGFSVITGCAPVDEMRAYPAEVQNYTRGRGHINLSFHGYAPCHRTEAVVSAIGYEPERDTRYPADSVFCSSGAGVIVPWREADGHMHVGSVFSPHTERPADKSGISGGNTGTHVMSSRSGITHSKPYSYADALAEDRELKAIFERTYGPIPARSIFVPPPPVTEVKPTRETYLKTLDPERDYLLVDGYNIIFAWKELAQTARENLDLARQMLIHILSNYQGYKKCNLILVFDAWRVRDGQGSVERHAGLYVIYTRSKETADTYIEKVTYDIGREHRVRVATSDAMEQVIVMGHGAIRLSAANLFDEVCAVNEEIEAIIRETNEKNR